MSNLNMYTPLHAEHDETDGVTFDIWIHTYFKQIEDMFIHIQQHIHTAYPEMHISNIHERLMFKKFAYMIYKTSSKYISPYM